MENRERSRIRDTSAQDQVLNTPGLARKQNRKHWIFGGLAAAMVIALGAWVVMGWLGGGRSYEILSVKYL